MSWITTITEAGERLLYAAPGRTLRYTRAACGNVTTPLDEARQATEMTGYVMDLAIVDYDEDEENEAARLRLQLDNSKVDDPFDLCKIAVWAQLFEDGEPFRDEVLVMFVQEFEYPDPIRKNPQVSEYLVYTKISQFAELEVTINPTAGVTVGMFRDLKESFLAHNDDPDAHPAIRDKIEELAGGGIAAHNTATDSHQDIRTKIGTDIAAHNSATDNHSDIRTALTNKANQADLTEARQKIEDHEALAVSTGTVHGIRYADDFFQVYANGQWLDIGKGFAPPARTLADNSWDVIARVSEAGRASDYWSIGDEKDITLTTGEALTLQIYGFDHDDLSSGGKAGITFGMKHLMAELQQMEATNINTNGFTGSSMYSWLTGTLLPSLPAELRSLIRPVTKKTSAGGQSTTILTEAMSIFLFSEVECFGTAIYSVAGEGSQYPVFTDAASQIKYQSNGTGSASIWWERSPRSINATDFCVVAGSDIAGTGYASVSYGVCFGFCV